MRAAVATVLTVLVAGSVMAEEKLVTKPSKYPVKETMDKLAAALEAKGIKPAARIDHAAAAKANGLELKPTEVLLFGNPKLGTPLMQANRAIGIDLPMKVLAWEDDAGKTWVGYVAADTLKARHGVTGKDDAFKAMTGALDAFTKAATE